MYLFKEEGVGGSPQSVFKKLKEQGRVPSDIQDMQLLALPQGTDADRYIDAVKDQFQGKAGCFILYLGEEKVKVPREELTGKCTNNEVKHSGARKWVTKYVVYTDSVKRLFDAEGNPEDIKEPQEVSLHETKGDAVTAAKDYAIANHTKTYIKLEKRLDENSGIQMVSEHEPQYKTVYDEKIMHQNRYLYFGVSEQQEAIEDDAEYESEVAEEAVAQYENESISEF